jgi:hypothetical protein
MQVSNQIVPSFTAILEQILESHYRNPVSVEVLHVGLKALEVEAVTDVVILRF